MSSALEGIVSAILAVFIGWVLINALIAASPGFLLIGALLMVVIVLAGLATLAGIFR
jgi:hypothetical protein